MSKFLTITCAFFMSMNVSAQEGIRTENKLGVESLVRDIFIKGNCKNVSDITAIGNESRSIGQFENGSNSININDGIILSTGDIELAQGPNQQIDASFAFDVKSNDPDLSQLATDELYDVTGVEFDFVPLDDRVTFRYVFASEEYCEFVGTSFNDVFGFFVSGPGINGNFENNAINVANIIALDGSNVSVSINNINHLSNQTFYVDNTTTTDAQNCETDYNPNFQELIEYDGFTIALTASFQVIPCETYHIRLVIGDVGDPNLDSAVFLETNSFDLGEAIGVRAEVPGSSEPIAYESCIDGQFVFTRGTSSNINEDLTVDYRISPDSKAINGVDFAEIPQSITIPAGENSYVLPIEIFEDNITEGPENLKLELFYDCDCIDPNLSELIIDEIPDELSINLEEISVCVNQLFAIAPEINGGIPPYNFLWETGLDTEIFESNVRENTQYSLTITDFCGNTKDAVAIVSILNTPKATLSGTYDLCEVSGTGIPVEFEGDAPWSLEYTIDGVQQTPIENIQLNPFYLDASVEGNYTLTSFRDTNCDGIIIGSSLVETGFFIDTEIKPPTCPKSSDGSIIINEINTELPFTIEWKFETDDNYFLENLSVGKYTLVITDSKGCFYERNFELKAASDDISECLSIYIPNIFSPNDDDIDDLFSVFYQPRSGIENISTFQVYNRWGELMYERLNFTPDTDMGWKGDHKGKPVNPDVFVYRIIVEFEDGSSQTFTGDITLVR